MDTLGPNEHAATRLVCSPKIAIAAATTAAVAADIAISLYPSARAWIVRLLASA